MTRFTKKDIENELTHLSTNALLCGLIQPGEILYYNAGNKTNGVTPVISIIQTQTKAREERTAYWVPRFTSTDSTRTQFAAVSAANLALRAAWDTIEALEKEKVSSK